MKYLLFFIFSLSPLFVWGADGDTFTAQTAEGVEMTFKVISENSKTCAVGIDDWSLTPAIEKGYNGAITIPSSINGYKVTCIGLYAFYECHMTSVSIPNSVDKIRSNAFGDCSKVESITIPSNVTTIEESAFYGCKAITNIYVENGNKNYDSRDNCNAIIEKSSNTLIAGCKNTIIPSTVTTIGTYALEGLDELTSIDIPNSVNIIGDYAFARSGLISVVIPGSVSTIGDLAFYNCANLKSVIIPNSVNRIGWKAFYYCYKLNRLKVEMTVPISIDNDVFSLPSRSKLYVPKSRRDSYAGAIGWEEFGTILEYPNSDVNQDGEIDVVDVVDIARYVVVQGGGCDDFLADLNSDDKIDVADAVMLVNEIAGETNFAKAFRTHQSRTNVEERISLTENNDHSLSLSLESDRNYTAFQFDLTTNGDTSVKDMLLNVNRKNGHQLLYNEVDERHYRVVVLSTANKCFNGENGELLNIQLDGIDVSNLAISNIHFISRDGLDYTFDDLAVQGKTTVISSSNIADKLNLNGIYDLQGRKQSALKRGVNIVNGKKVIIK